MSFAGIVLAFVTAQRLAELLLARRNTKALLARGAYEVGARHYPLVIALHAAWLAGLWLLAGRGGVSLGWLALFIALQAARIWVISSLGPRWTTRILVLPGERLVRRGPYRYIPHPNYLVVAGEIAVLPLVLGLPLFAILFSALNAAVLAIRVRAEDAALAASRAPNPC